MVAICEVSRHFYVVWRESSDPFNRSFPNWPQNNWGIRSPAYRWNRTEFSGSNPTWPRCSYVIRAPDLILFRPRNPVLIHRSDLSIFRRFGCEPDPTWLPPLRQLNARLFSVLFQLVIFSLWILLDKLTPFRYSFCTWHASLCLHSRLLQSISLLLYSGGSLRGRDYRALSKTWGRFIEGLGSCLQRLKSSTLEYI